MLKGIGQLRLKDLEIFQEVAQIHSIREVARRGHLTPGQVSKTIQNVEKTLGFKLFKRSPTGIFLTSEGSEVEPYVRDLLLRSEKIEGVIAGQSRISMTKTFTMGGTSFINAHFSAPLVTRMNHKTPTFFRFLDMAPDQLVPMGMRGVCEIAIHYGELSWPRTWTTASLGQSGWSLYVGARHPLNENASLKQILEYPFIAPTYWTLEGMRHGNDQFPIPFSKRKIGHETATAEAAVPILRATQHIAFLPDILGRTFLKRRQLKKISCKDLAPSKKELFLSVKSDSISAPLFEKLTKALSKGV